MTKPTNKPFFVLCAILLACTGKAAATDFSEYDLKNLFTTPELRKQIDAARRGGAASTGAQRLGSSTIRINGVVRRKNGKSVVWVNDSNTLDNSNINGVKVYTRALDKKSKVPVNIDGRVVYLRPGQTWSKEAGKVIDSY